MALKINGIDIPREDTVIMDNIAVHKVIQDGVLVWSKLGQVVIDFDTVSGPNSGTVLPREGDGLWSFTVPAFLDTIHICMVGGAGAGASSRGGGPVIGSEQGGGGFKGEGLNIDLDVTPSSVIEIVIGKGGPGGRGNETGLPGGLSSFGDETVAGGLGGWRIDIDSAPEAGYVGDGDEHTSPCGGIFHDGLTKGGDELYHPHAHGGEAGWFGSGGAAEVVRNTWATDGEVSAGGGGHGYSEGAHEMSGNGGNGRIVISW